MADQVDWSGGLQLLWIRIQHYDILRHAEEKSSIFFRTSYWKRFFTPSLITDCIIFANAGPANLFQPLCCVLVDYLCTGTC